MRESIRRPQGNPPLKELMEKGGDLYGMQTFEMHIKRIVREGYTSLIHISEPTRTY